MPTHLSIPHTEWGYFLVASSAAQSNLYMTSLKLASWNTRGLNGPIKRSVCLDLFRRKNVDIAFVQEFHLKEADVHRFANRYVAASASFVSKSRGSLVVLKRSLSINILEKFGSSDGRISLIKTITAGRKLAFLSVYTPNKCDQEFFQNLSQFLVDL